MEVQLKRFEAYQGILYGCMLLLFFFKSFLKIEKQDASLLQYTGSAKLSQDALQMSLVSQINGQEARALVDTGATATFPSRSHAEASGPGVSKCKRELVCAIPKRQCIEI